MSLDPWGPMLGVLFEDGSSDYILQILKLIGIPTEFQLTAEESYSHKTRKRAYEKRLGPIVAAFDERGKRRIAQNLARELAKSNDQTAQRLNQALEGVGWTFQNGTLLSQSPIENEAFFSKGTDHDAYVHIRRLLQGAIADLVIIDPYMDGTVYQILGTLPSPVAVKILTSKVPSDFALEGKKFLKQHSGFGLELRKTKDFHDRFIILDQRKCYLLGASIKDAGNKGFTIVPLEDPGVIQFFLGYASQVWDAASNL